MASNVKIDARMFRQWISSGKDESKYYPKEIVSKGILGGNCGRDPAFVSAQFGKGGQEILMKNAAKIKLDGKDRDFDCIMGLSGGLDSSYAAYIAKEVMGLRPLLLHVDAGWNSELAVANIESVIKYLEKKYSFSQ